MSIEIDRLPSSDPSLDAVFGGGLPANAINLIGGLPGTGKTVLAQQYVYANATQARPALYLSTVSEPFEKIIRYGQTLDFFDARAIGSSVFYEDLSVSLGTDGVTGALDEIDRLLKGRRPALLVIDSFKALLAYADGSRELRQFIHDLAGLLTALPVTTLWVGEYGADELGSAAECAVADSIIYLHTVHTGTREMRFLQPLKMRGSTFGSGSHAYRISKSGIDVFPRLADAGSGADYRLDQTRQKSGIRQLDVMLGDGYFPGSVTLVAGPAGVGKTVMGLHFIVEGALHGEPGVIATLAENPSQLRRTAQGFGWTLEEAGVELMYRSPVDLHVDEWMYDLLATIERTKARRVMVDSLTDLRLASPEPVRFREYVYSFTHRCSRAGVSVLMTTEVSELFRIDSLSDTGVANLSENVILLQYVAEPTELRRTVTVLKTRASAHDSRIREFTITDAGIVLGGVIEPTIAQF